MFLNCFDVLDEGHPRSLVIFLSNEPSIRSSRKLHRPLNFSIYNQYDSGFAWLRPFSGNLGNLLLSKIIKSISNQREMDFADFEDTDDLCTVY